MLSCAPLWLYVILSFIAQEELQLVVGMLVYKSFLLCKIAYQVNIIVLTEGINSLLCLFDFFIICRILKICIDVCVHVLPFSYGKFQTHSKVKRVQCIPLCSSSGFNSHQYFVSLVSSSWTFFLEYSKAYSRHVIIFFFLILNLETV